MTRQRNNCLCTVYSHVYVNGPAAVFKKQQHCTVWYELINIRSHTRVRARTHTLTHAHTNAHSHARPTDTRALAHSRTYEHSHTHTSIYKYIHTRTYYAKTVTLYSCIPKILIYSKQHRT